MRCRKHNGDEDAALSLILEAFSNGGVVSYLKLMDGLQSPSSPMKPVADARERHGLSFDITYGC